MSEENTLEVLAQYLREWAREANVKGDIELAKAFQADADLLTVYLNKKN